MPPVSAPLTTPTPNTGAQAQAILIVSQALELMQKAMGMVGPSTPLGQALLDSMKKLGKQAGSAPAEQQVNSLQSQLIEAQRSAMQRAALQQQSMAGGGAPGGAMASPGASAAGPMPSPLAA